MSEENEAVDTPCCASCGIAEIDDIELTECDYCDLVQYCSDECEENHKSEHEEACNERSAELHDELLFKQPEGTHLGDCPICCIPLQLEGPLDVIVNMKQFCCSKTICCGCFVANLMREEEGRLQHTCPFCREPVLMGSEESLKQNMKRIAANDPVAICQEANEQYMEGDYIKAFEYWSKAAELGDAEAHSRLAMLYRLGEGVEENEGNEIHHYEEAAIAGHPDARHNLGVREWTYGNYDRATKHIVIAARQGNNASIKQLMNAFKMGFISKEDLAAALRAHQAAVDATKSPQREAAEEAMK